MPTVAWSRLLHLVPADDVRVSVSRTKSLTRYFGKSHKERSPVCGQRYALVIYVECSRRKDKGFLNTCALLYTFPPGEGPGAVRSGDRVETDCASPMASPLCTTALLYAEVDFKLTFKLDAPATRGSAHFVGWQVVFLHANRRWEGIGSVDHFAV